MVTKQKQQNRKHKMNYFCNSQKIFPNKYAIEMKKQVFTNKLRINYTEFFLLIMHNEKEVFIPSLTYGSVFRYGILFLPRNKIINKLIIVTFYLTNRTLFLAILRKTKSEF